MITLMLISCENNKDSGNGNITGQGGSMARFAIKGDFLHTLDESQLSTYRIAADGQLMSNPNTVRMRDNMETIFPKDSFLFLGASNGMYVYNINQSGLPVYHTDVQHFTSCDPVVANDSLAFVTLNGASDCRRGSISLLQVYDIKPMLSNSGNLQPKLLYETPMTNPKGLGIKDKVLYVCDDGLQLYELLDSTAELAQRRSFPIDANDVITLKTHLIVLGSDAIYQYSYPTGGESLNLLSKLN